MSFGHDILIPRGGKPEGPSERGPTTPENPPEFELPPEQEVGPSGRDKGSRMLRDKPPEFWNELGGLLRDNGLERARGGDLAKFFAKDPAGQEFVDKWDVNVGQAKQAARALLGRGDRPEGPHPREGHDYEGGRANRDINPDKTYKTPEWMMRQYNLPETIRGSNLIKVQTVLSLGGNEALQASVRAELLGLNLGLDIGGNNIGSTGGLFDGLQFGINPQGVRNVPVAGEPVGTIDGRPVYQTAQGQLVYSTDVPVSAQAQARLVGPDGQPVTGLTTNTQTSAGVDGTATGSTASTTAAANPSTGAPTTGSGLTYNEAAAGTTAPGTPTTPAPTGGVTPTGADAAAASAAATQAGATTAAATGNSRATAAATGQSNTQPGAQVAHNPGGPPPWAPAYGTKGFAGHPVHGGDQGGPGRGLIDGLQQLLSELLGVRVSRGQTQQFVNQLSQAELSAFLANPVQRLPDVMSTLMSVVMRDHGRPGRAGREALLALFDHLMSRNPSAREIHNFFKSLTPDQIEQLIAHRAEMIGNLPGVPQEVRAAANLQRIEAELTVMQGSRDPAAQRRAQTLEHLLTQNAQILHFDNAPDGRLAAGRISQVFGNLAEAKYVGVMLPGLNNTMDNFSARAQRGQLLHQLAQPMAREGTAMVVWLERLGQEVLRQYRSMLTSWQAREQQTRAPMTFQQALAQAARQLAQESVPGMMLRGDARLTFVGHSFGSLIAKEALNHGAKPDACVFLGMPENRLKKIAAQAGCGDVDLYSMVADGDTVDEAVAADEAPEAAEAVDAAGLDEEIDRLDPGKDLVPPIEAVLDPHDNYGLEGSASLAQIVGVTLGWRPKLLPPEPSVITLYRSADGTYEDHAEPVGWFGPKGEEW